MYLEEKEEEEEEIEKEEKEEVEEEEEKEVEGKVEEEVPLEGLRGVPHHLPLHELLVVVELVPLLAAARHDGQGGDGVVELPQAVAAVEDLEDAPEGEGEPEEHDGVLAARVVAALQQPQAVAHLGER